MIRHRLSLAALWLAITPAVVDAQTLISPPGTNGGGTGTVTSIICNGGLSGGAITTSGTCALSAPVSVANGGTGQASLAAAGLPVLIQQQSMAGVGSVTFAAIPNTYKDLMVRYRGAGAASATFVNVGLQFNGDTGSNYDTQEAVINNTTNAGGASVAQTSILAGYLPAASGVANLGGGGDIQIFDYNGATYFKEVTAVKGVRLSGVAGGYYAGSIWGSWRNTAAITSVTVVLSSGSGAATTTVSLYGLP
jgi:hypothetical protein